MVRAGDHIVLPAVTILLLVGMLVLGVTRAGRRTTDWARTRLWLAVATVLGPWGFGAAVVGLVLAWLWVVLMMAATFTPRR